MESVTGFNGWMDGAMGWSGRVACKCDMFGVPDVGNGVLLSLGDGGLLGLRRLLVH